MEVVKIKRSEYRKKKLEWFERNERFSRKNLEFREKEYRLRKRDQEIMIRRTHLETELVNMRITREKMMYAMDKFNSDEREREENEKNQK